MNPTTDNANTNNANNNVGATNAANPPTSVVTAADIPWQLKAKYFSSGVVVGVIVSPVVRKAGDLLKAAYSQAEEMMEKGSDLVGKAKEKMKNDDGDLAAHGHRHN